MKLFQSKVTIYISILAVLAVIGAFYFWSVLSSGGINIDLNTDGESLVGQPFDLKVNFVNDSRNILNDA
ncbi:MAG: hypothetical protein Q8R55_06205, partial [Candidatus Taylorbacteria bacterium]|nr:hypothetical protein [Candidatus Taylorbacteria bacterium]